MTPYHTLSGTVHLVDFKRENYRKLNSYPVHQRVYKSLMLGIRILDLLELNWSRESPLFSSLTFKAALAVGSAAAVFGLPPAAVPSSFLL